MPRTLPGDENTLLHTHPYNFNSPPEKTDLGKENPESHSLRYGLRMEPYMTQEHAITQKMKLIGVISHQGTKEHGHYVAITKRGNEWISHNDATTTQTTPAHLHQS